MTEQSSVTEWIHLLRGGDGEAAERLWGRYFDRLAHAVRARLRGADRAGGDEEDIALSVFDSFYEAAGRGRFPDLADRDSLWRLLLGMAARKVIDKRRRDQRQRRGGGVRPISIYASCEDDGIVEVIGDEPTPEMVLMVQESVQELFSYLGVGPLRDLAVAKLEGSTNAELALRWGCSERTIERRLRLIREKCSQAPPRNDEHPPDTPERRRAGAD